jgi:hypothetical protein
MDAGDFKDLISRLLVNQHLFLALVVRNNWLLFWLLAGLRVRILVGSKEVIHFN